MTLLERAAEAAQKLGAAANREDAVTRIRETLVAELRDVVADCERMADAKLTLYKDLGMDGVKEASAFRTVAHHLRQRAGI